MLARGQAVTHHASPALWGLLGVMAGEVLLILLWNAAEHRHELANAGRRLLRL